MTIKSRRHVLKGVGLALPAIWARPVVEAVVLPAHAQTSTPGGNTPVNCSAPVDCYGIGETVTTIYFFWPEEGAGPHPDLLVFEDECFGTPTDETVTAVVAASAAEAASALTCTTVAEILTVPALSGGCAFYTCVDP